jgi:predicted transcriptional regulator
MRSQALRVRLPADVVLTVEMLAETYATTVSAVLRLAVREFLARDEDAHALLAAGHEAALEDMRSPQQAAAWERDKARLETLPSGLLMDNTPV